MLPSRLWGDDVRIRQVLVNLMNNVVKYTEKGQVQLCTKQLDNIEAMTGILKPDLAILSHPVTASNRVILDWFQKKHSKIPVLVLLDNKEAPFEKELFDNEQFAVFSILQSKPAGYILKPADQENVLNTVKNVLSK